MAVVGTWIAGLILGAGASAGALAITGSLINSLIGVAVSMALAKINAPEGPRPRELTTELRSSNAKRVRHFGKVRTSGTVVFYEWATVGFSTRRLYKLIAVAEGGMSNVTRFYLDGKPVNVDSDGYVTTAPWNKGNVRLRWRSGIPGNADIDGGLWGEMQSSFPGYWTTDHRMRGIGTILATFDDVEGDEISEVYSGGDPEVSALIDGAPAYWIPADNYANTREPSRQLCDLLVHPTYGIMTNDDLNVNSFIAARNVGIEEIPTVGGTRPRYQSGISFALSDPLKDTAQKLLDAMGGRAWIDGDGKLEIEAGIWTAPTVTIEEKHIHEMEYGAGTNRISRVTTLVPSYVAPEIRWQETTADPWDDTNAIATWGEGEPKSMDLLAVQNHAQARHLCRQMMAKMNPKRKMTIKLGMFGLRLIEEKKVNINIPRIGLVNTPFLINSFSFDGQNVVIDVIQADPASFNWSASLDGEPPTDVTDYDRANPVFSTTIGSLVVVGNSGAPYIRVTGTYAASWGYTGYAQFRKNGDTEWTDMIRETAGTNQYRFRSSTLEDGGIYQVRSYVAPADGHTWKIKSTPVVVTGIDVIANNQPPSNPVISSESGTAGGTLVVNFEPDLGVNYWRTGLYRAGPTETFADAVWIKWSYATSSVVIMNDNIPVAGARYWLQSENPSRVPSGAVLVGTYT